MTRLVDRPRLVLGSASPARLETLRRAGIEPIVRPSGVDEDAALAAARATYGRLGCDDVALLLARAKCEAVARSTAAEPVADDGSGGGALVLGCDSVLELDGEPYGKPANPEQARSWWQRMRGRSGVLHTGHWLIDLRPTGSDGPASGPGSGATVGAVSATTVHFAEITDTELDAYLATGEPQQVAGAFTTDGLGGAFVRGIEGDHHNVVGVSLPLLRGLLADCGLGWTDLWQRAGTPGRP
jgi:septum formation protein